MLSAAAPQAAWTAKINKKNILQEAFSVPTPLSGAKKSIGDAWLVGQKDPETLFVVVAGEDKIKEVSGELYKVAPRVVDDEVIDVPAIVASLAKELFKEVTEGSEVSEEEEALHGASASDDKTKDKMEEAAEDEAALLCEEIVDLLEIGADMNADEFFGENGLANAKAYLAEADHLEGASYTEDILVDWLADNRAIYIKPAVSSVTGSSDSMDTNSGGVLTDNGDWGGNPRERVYSDDEYSGDSGAGTGVPRPKQRMLESCEPGDLPLGNSPAKRDSPPPAALYGATTEVPDSILQARRREAQSLTL